MTEYVNVEFSITVDDSGDYSVCPSTDNASDIQDAWDDQIGTYSLARRTFVILLRLPKPEIANVGIVGDVGPDATEVNLTIL